MESHIRDPLTGEHIDLDPLERNLYDDVVVRCYSTQVQCPLFILFFFIQGIHYEILIDVFWDSVSS